MYRMLNKWNEENKIAIPDKSSFSDKLTSTHLIKMLYVFMSPPFILSNARIIYYQKFYAHSLLRAVHLYWPKERLP